MRLTRGGLQYRPFHRTEALNIQIKRLLNDREVFAGDKVFDARERFYAYVEHAGGKLVAMQKTGALASSGSMSLVAMSFT